MSPAGGIKGVSRSAALGLLCGAERQEALGRVEVHVQAGRYPDELPGLGVPDMAAWAGLLGEGTEVFKVNPLTFLQAGRHLGQHRVQDRGRVDLR